MGGENEIMKGSMEEAVAELVLERWGRICLCRDRGKGLLVGGNGMSLHFSKEDYGGPSLGQVLITHWVRVWVLRKKTQT